MKLRHVTSFSGPPPDALAFFAPSKPMRVVLSMEQRDCNVMRLVSQLTENAASIKGNVFAVVSSESSDSHPHITPDPKTRFRQTQALRGRDETDLGQTRSVRPAEIEHIHSKDTPLLMVGMALLRKDSLARFERLCQQNPHFCR